MTPDKATIVACIKRAAVLSALFAVHIAALHSAARAQMPGEMLAAPFAVAPDVIPVAAPAATPAAVPAVVMPQTRSAASDLDRPAVPTAAAAPAPIACIAPAELTHFERPLLHTMRRLASGRPLTVIAIGSSSTAGAGASSPAATYPSRLAVALRARFPGRDITVLNRGVNGEETDDMMARFATDVVAAHPQLVLWQVGTNSVLRDHPLNPHSVELHKGIEELKATDADVVLIDPQYAPKVLAKSETSGMVEQIALEAKAENVDLFRRFEVMRDWHEVQHLGFDVFVSPDRLHMNDWGYACWAKLIGAAIADAATRPIAAAAAHPPH
jgi:acyl-CoA thioesterase I